MGWWSYVNHHVHCRERRGSAAYGVLLCAVDYFVSHGAWHYGALDVEKGAKVAYPFMALMVLQGILLSIGHAVYAQPGGDGFVGYVVNALAYAAIGAAYVALKLRRRAERRAKVEVRQDVPA